MRTQRWRGLVHPWPIGPFVLCLLGCLSVCLSLSRAHACARTHTSMQLRLLHNLYSSSTVPQRQWLISRDHSNSEHCALPSASKMCVIASFCSHDENNEVFPFPRKTTKCNSSYSVFCSILEIRSIGICFYSEQFCYPIQVHCICLVPYVHLQSAKVLVAGGNTELSYRDAHLQTTNPTLPHAAKQSSSVFVPLSSSISASCSVWVCVSHRNVWASFVFVCLWRGLMCVNVP